MHILTFYRNITHRSKTTVQIVKCYNIIRHCPDTLLTLVQRPSWLEYVDTCTVSWHYLIVDVLLLVKNGSHLVRVAVKTRLDQRRLQTNKTQQQLIQTDMVQQQSQLTTASTSARRRPTSCLMAPTLWLKHQRTRDDASENALNDVMSLISTDVNKWQSSTSVLSHITLWSLRHHSG